MPKPRNKTDIERWQEEAMKVKSDESPSLSLPFHVVLGEAIDVAKFFERYLDEDKANALPSLRSVMNGKNRISTSTGEEILSLQRAIQEAQTRYLMVASPRSKAPDRGRFLLDELDASLEFLFDDGVEDENDDRLRRVRAAHPDTTAVDALASALDDYAGIAEHHREDLHGLGGFDASMIEEAREIAKGLRESPDTRGASEEAKRAIALRNNLIGLLNERIGAVRSAARYVFRGHPAIVREVMSAYERRRRAASKRRANAKKAGPQKPS